MNWKYPTNPRFLSQSETSYFDIYRIYNGSPDRFDGTPNPIDKIILTEFEQCSLNSIRTERLLYFKGKTPAEKYQIAIALPQITAAYWKDKVRQYYDFIKNANLSMKIRWQLEPWNRHMKKCIIENWNYLNKMES